MKRRATVPEKDACAIIAMVDKRGRSTHANIVRTVDALRKMGHRSGDIHGEGDGCGLMTDIPRDVWARRLGEYGMSPHLAESGSFFVGHFLVPANIRSHADDVTARIRGLLHGREADVVMELKGCTRDEELGPRARAEAPLFWQVAGMIPDQSRQASSRRLFALQLEIERQVPEIHIASLDLDTVVYKLRGMPDSLPRVYPELLDEDTHSVITLGHGRYSTNTLPTVERAQPFSVLEHNGEINTIERLRRAGRVLGIEPVPGGSDSQDLNRVVEGLMHLFDLDLLEAMEMVFPPVHSEVAHYPKDLQGLYAFYRWFFPCSAQGPAAVVARRGWVCMGSVDALGLRPLWFGETDYDYFLSSEKGVVDIEHTLQDPKPLAPGEKIAIVAGRGRRAEVLDHGAFQGRLIKLMGSRRKAMRCIRSLYKGLPARRPGQSAATEPLLSDFLSPGGMGPLPDQPTSANRLSAFGWQRYDLNMIERMAVEGLEAIGSMGHQGPLAAFVPEALPNIADFFKENVAVVTNPAIDREREAEHFSTRVILGDRPDALGEKAPPAVGLELESPLLLEGESLKGVLAPGELRGVAAGFGTVLIEDALDFFSSQRRDPTRVRVLDATHGLDEGLSTRLEGLCQEAQEAVRAGAVLVVLDDSRGFNDGRVFCDPALACAYLVRSLEAAGLRREASLAVRSAAVRNLHDIMFLLGVGADAVDPYLMWRVVCGFADKDRPPERMLFHAMGCLQKGMEKVMSTMGIHELCGYGRIFASIGLTDDLAEVFQGSHFCSGRAVGLGLSRLEGMARARYEKAASEGDGVYGEPARNPKVGRLLRAVAVGKKGYLDMAVDLERLEKGQPVALRHLFDVRRVPEGARFSMDYVDISIGRHSMPLVIAAMSFGSQGESSFRAYAEAAKKANIICMNGEGGEIPDMLGRYRHNRGQQIASGRFGVYMDFLNSTDYLEIKIGQGAKPGEGGHLPGAKVSAMVAAARHCKPGITLISPSNHHDIYSIEDLAQIITELKTANPEARVSVKIPVTSGVGTIAVGIVKAGAAIVNLSGFEGGTGAAREHAKRFVGLPAEIGVSEAHRALVASGLREKVEIWCDGGMRSGADVLKMILLGANRVGFGTVALMGVGCISCQRCHLDRCPRGISTQLRTKADAEERGIKGFSPRDVETEAENLARLLRGMGDEIRVRLAELGVRRLQDLVGRTDLLVQARLTDRIDLSGLLARPEPAETLSDEKDHRFRVCRKPLNYLTKLISDIAMDRFRQGQTAVHFAEEGVSSTDRAVGTYLAGAMVREYGSSTKRRAFLTLSGSVPGNGLCAFNIPNIDTEVEGGSQDGAAKGISGGCLAVLRGLNLAGRRVDGSTGKSFAYGAIGGQLIVQNMADSRACIRMSGADVVFGGRMVAPIRDHEGNIASRAHLKGFAFEYMTGGRAVVLGDPGPWICSGMTGGVIYQCLYPEYGFDRAALRRRLARGANVGITSLTEGGVSDVEGLLGRYIEELRRSFQAQEAAAVSDLLGKARERFVMIVPKAMRPPSAA